MGALAIAQNEQTDIDAALPPARRDLLGNVCFYFHFLVMAFIVTGWAYSWRPALFFYLVLLPLVILQWQVNKSSCVLNNIEGWLRSGHWRNPENKEEGAWFLNLVKDLIGIALQPWQANAINYGVVILFWFLALWHVSDWRH